MRGHGNVTGADVVMRYTLSYPFGISMTRGYPRFNPGEYSTIDLLVRGDNDATIVIGADPGATMPKPAVSHPVRFSALHELPSIAAREVPPSAS